MRCPRRHVINVRCVTRAIVRVNRPGAVHYLQQWFAPSDPAMEQFNPEGPHDIVMLFSAQNAWATFGMAQTWIGAAAGIAMIFAAVHFRRTRDEG